MKKPRPQMVIVEDTREALPFRFSGVEVVRRCLETGDYSVEGFESEVVVERKGLGDFVGSLTMLWPKEDEHGRLIESRFERELIRLREFSLARIVVEGSISEIIRHEYRADVHPNCIMGMAYKVENEFGIPIVWAESHRLGAVYTQGLLARWWKTRTAETHDAEQWEYTRAHTGE
jgi:ERCC4-type nuclease